MLDLLDYRRRVNDLYHTIRTHTSPEEAWQIYRAARDDLFKNHPQSALDDNQKKRFTGLEYYDYDPAYRVIADIDLDDSEEVFDVNLGDDGQFQFKRIGKVRFALPSGAGQLSLYWIMGYGGGVFLPFRDGTNNESSYGGGRYLLDTIKGADLGYDGTGIILDFNFAYHPSCYYNPRWVCPLSLPENTLGFPVRAGERLLNSL